MRELLAFVQSRPEPEAQEVFNLIRGSATDDVFDILRQIREQGVPPPLTSVSSNENRLPPINQLFEVSRAAQPPSNSPFQPPTLPFTYSNGSSQSYGSRSRGSGSSTEPLSVPTAPAYD